MACWALETFARGFCIDLSGTEQHRPFMMRAYILPHMMWSSQECLAARGTLICYLQKASCRSTWWSDACCVASHCTCTHHLVCAAAFAYLGVHVWHCFFMWREDFQGIEGVIRLSDGPNCHLAFASELS